MSRLGGVLSRLQGAALYRHQVKVQRRILCRPHVPSTYLVAGYPADANLLQVLEEAEATEPWFRVVLLVLAFAAGVLVASILLQAAPSARLESNDLVCSTVYAPPQQ